MEKELTLGRLAAKYKDVMLAPEVLAYASHLARYTKGVAFEEAFHRFFPLLERSENEATRLFEFVSEVRNYGSALDYSYTLYSLNIISKEVHEVMNIVSDYKGNVFIKDGRYVARLSKAEADDEMNNPCGPTITDVATNISRAKNARTCVAGDGRNVYECDLDKEGVVELLKLHKSLSGFTKKFPSKEKIRKMPLSDARIAEAANEIAGYRGLSESQLKEFMSGQAYERFVAFGKSQNTHTLG